jgi:hypothetical protein
MQRIDVQEILVSSHANLPLDTESVFCVAPSEIGTLKSAFSTLNPKKIRWLPWLSAVCWGASAAFLGWAVAMMINKIIFTEIPLLYPLLMIPFFCGAFYLWAPAARITYVGDKGWYAWSKKFGKVCEETLLFQHDHLLFSRVTSSYHNGIYTGTDYAFCFLHPQKDKSHNIEGRYLFPKDKPPADNEFYFAKSAEQAYTDFRIAPLLAHLRQGETVDFVVGMSIVQNTTPTMTITLALESLTITQKDKQEIIPIADLSHVSIQNGWVLLARKGGKAGFLGIGRDGVYQFEYALLSNALLFFRTIAMLIENQ